VGIIGISIAERLSLMRSDAHFVNNCGEKPVHSTVGLPLVAVATVCDELLINGTYLVYSTHGFVPHAELPLIVIAADKGIPCKCMRRLLEKGYQQI
jgi:hypothetical protein